MNFVLGLCTVPRGDNPKKGPANTIVITKAEKNIKEIKDFLAGKMQNHIPSTALIFLPNSFISSCLESRPMQLALKIYNQS